MFIAYQKYDSSVGIVVVAHIYPLVTEQRQMLNIGQSALFTFQ